MIAKPALAGSKKRRRTRYITLPQANNLVAACEFAKRAPLLIRYSTLWRQQLPKIENAAINKHT
jgi:hypothetical protein